MTPTFPSPKSEAGRDFGDYLIESKKPQNNSVGDNKKPQDQRFDTETQEVNDIPHQPEPNSTIEGPDLLSELIQAPIVTLPAIENKPENEEASVSEPIANNATVVTLVEKDVSIVQNTDEVVPVAAPMIEQKAEEPTIEEKTLKPIEQKGNVTKEAPIIPMHKEAMPGLGESKEDVLLQNQQTHIPNQPKQEIPQSNSENNDVMQKMYGIKDVKTETEAALTSFMPKIDAPKLEKNNKPMAEITTEASEDIVEIAVTHFAPKAVSPAQEQDLLDDAGDEKVLADEEIIINEASAKDPEGIITKAEPTQVRASNITDVKHTKTLVLKQVSENITNAIKNNNGEIKITLNPDSLGQVQIQISTSPMGKIEAIKLIVEEPKTLEMIAMSQAELIESLKQVVNISESQLSLEGRGEGQNERKQNQQNMVDFLAWISEQNPVKITVANTNQTIYTTTQGLRERQLDLTL
ncbi:MAG UNVERIFIED_CONTAM: flagellar hook-length control protein FliK [Planctomycetaceae bacterium]